MFASSSKASDIAAEKLGVWITRGYGIAFPELKKMLLNLYRDKVSLLNFVPSGWFAAVQKLQDENPNDLVRIAPSQLKNGSPIDTMPEWTNTSWQVSNAWQSLFDATNAAISDFAQQQQTKGKAELDRLNANAQFWNTAYTIGTYTGVVGAQAAVEGAKEFVADNQLNFKVVGVVVGILAALWVLAPYFTGKR